MALPVKAPTQYERASLSTHAPGSARRCARSSPRSWSRSTTSGWRSSRSRRIDVDDELNRAIVYFDSLAGEDGDAEIARGARAATASLAGVDRPPDPRQEDADPRLPARRRDPRRRSASTTSSARTASGTDRRRPAAEPMATALSRPTVARAGASSTSRPGSPATTSSACCAAASASAQSATPARSTPTPPGCSSSASARSPGCCASSSDGRKRYTGEVVLGVETDTLDAAGEVDGHATTWPA